MSKPLEVSLYNGRYTITRDESHVYRVNGERVRGVTGLIQHEPKPALEKWKRKQAAEAAVREYKQCGRLREAVEHGMRAPASVAGEAADRGTRIHEACEELLTKGSYVANDLTDNEIRAVEEFSTWCSSNVERVYATERPVYSPSCRYVGTLDLLVQRKGEGAPTVWDIKTGARVYPSVLMQLAAYTSALLEEYPMRRARIGGVILFVKAQGRLTGELQVLELNHDVVFQPSLNAFRGLQKLLHWQERAETWLDSRSTGLRQPPPGVAW